jgi:ABC-type transporter Mla MlaB component
MLRFAAETHQLTANAANPSAAPIGWSVERSDPDPGRAELELCGRLSLRDAPAAIAELRRQLEPHGGAVRIGLSNLRALDSASAALLLELRDELRLAGAGSRSARRVARRRSRAGRERAARASTRRAGARRPDREVGRASAGVLCSRARSSTSPAASSSRRAALRDPGRILAHDGSLWSAPARTRCRSSPSSPTWSGWSAPSRPR